MTWDRRVTGEVRFTFELRVGANREEVARELAVRALQEMGVGADNVVSMTVDPPGDWCGECLAVRTVIDDDGVTRPCPACSS